MAAKKKVTAKSDVRDEKSNPPKVPIAPASEQDIASQTATGLTPEGLEAKHPSEFPPVRKPEPKSEQERLERMRKDSGEANVGNYRSGGADHDKAVARIREEAAEAENKR
jgi:hypothetical protein